MEEDISKFQLDTLEMKALMLMNLCCIKLRKSYCNKRTWEVAVEVMEDIQVDMEEVTEEDMVEFQAVMDHPKFHHLMAHPDMVQAVLLVLISVMLSKDTKLHSS